MVQIDTERPKLFKIGAILHHHPPHHSPAQFHLTLENTFTPSPFMPALLKRPYRSVNLTSTLYDVSHRAQPRTNPSLRETKGPRRNQNTCTSDVNAQH